MEDRKNQFFFYGKFQAELLLTKAFYISTFSSPETVRYINIIRCSGVLRGCNPE